MTIHRAWKLYLEMCQDPRKNRAFFGRLRAFVRRGYTVHRRPEIWPIADWLLCDRGHEAIVAASHPEVSESAGAARRDCGR